MPEDITVPVGTTVTWRNGETNGHTITSGAWATSTRAPGCAARSRPRLGARRLAVSLLAAIDANIAGDPAYCDLFKVAASHMPMTSTAPAGGEGV